MCQTLGQMPNKTSILMKRMLIGKNVRTLLQKNKKRKHSPEVNNSKKLGGSLKNLAIETSSPILRAPRVIEMRERTYSIASGLGTPSNRRKKQASSKIKGRARCNSTRSRDENQRKITDMLEPRQENVPDNN